MKGWYGIDFNEATGSTIELGSHSKIVSSYTGIRIDYVDHADVTNHGVIDALYAIAIGGASDDTIVNRGTMKGHIALGGGNDVYDNLGGSVDHAINGGVGDDTLITDNATVMLKENADEGFDTVKSTVSYTLNENVERLILIGKADIDGTGTKEVDQLFGNGSDNLLFARDGADTLDGGKGDDRLRGIYL